MSTENNKDFQWTDEAAKAFAKFAKKRSEEFPIELWDNEVLSMFKQDWEKRRPEYEILSFRDPCSSACSRIVTYQSPLFSKEDWTQRWLNAKAPIHSVRRLSDGEVFSVGDQIDATGEKCRIIGFNVAPNWSGGLMVCTDETKDSASALKLITKLPTPKPIFRTEDGVDLFSISDTVYGVCPKGTWETRELGLLLEPNKTNWKWFAIPYNRDRYILMNKPTLSVNEVLDIFRDHEVFDELVSALHERAKAKL
jgi:hypothetical protein